MCSQIFYVLINKISYLSNGFLTQVNLKAFSRICFCFSIGLPFRGLECISLAPWRWKSLQYKKIDLILHLSSRKTWVFRKIQNMKTYPTRMHSSRMRTARLLTVSQHALRRGVSAQGEVRPGGCLPRGCMPRGCLPRGVSAQGVSGQEGCIPACNRADTPYGQTDTCENITFANFVCRQ